MTVKITRVDLSAAELRGAAARSCGMDRQTLRDRAHRYNADGLAGLSDRSRRNGPRPRLSTEQLGQVGRWVGRGRPRPGAKRRGALVLCRPRRGSCARFGSVSVRASPIWSTAVGLRYRLPLAGRAVDAACGMRLFGRFGAV